VHELDEEVPKGSVPLRVDSSVITENRTDVVVGLELFEDRYLVESVVQVLSVEDPVGQRVITEGVAPPGEVPMASVFDSAAEPSPSRLHEAVGVTDVASVVGEGHIVKTEGEGEAELEFGSIVTMIGEPEGNWDP